MRREAKKKTQLENKQPEQHPIQQEVRWRSHAPARHRLVKNFCPAFPSFTSALQILFIPRSVFPTHRTTAILTPCKESSDK